MNHTEIYNVVTSGHSVGMTFDLKEAQRWLKESKSNDKKIVTMKWSCANGWNGKVDNG